MKPEDTFDFEPSRGAGVYRGDRPTVRSRFLGHPGASPSGQTTETSPCAAKLALHGTAARSYTQPVPVHLVGRF